MRLHIHVISVGLGIALCSYSFAGPPAGAAGFAAGRIYSGTGRSLSSPRGAIAGPGISRPPYPPANVGYWSASGFHGFTRPAGNVSIRRSSNHRRDYSRVPYPYFFAPYYYPFLDYASAPYDDYTEYLPENVGPDPALQGLAQGQSVLGQQVQNLTAEIQQLKAGQIQQPEPNGTEAGASPQTTPITLVMQNGKQLKVQNYAVMDGVFWDFSGEPARKIPISDIDIDASTKASEASGAEFPQLTGSSGEGGN
ncbi:MAG: hypothetical protein JOZ62_05015 [Acidobacteriaceae bacterium]|nr:hypothetical protein [Acidobacteriaceae bacterium]